MRSKKSAQGTLKARDPTLELNKARERADQPCGQRERERERKRVYKEACKLDVCP